MADHPDATNVAVRDRLLHELFYAALSGGSRHWCDVLRLSDHPDLFHATIEDIDRRTHGVNRTTILKGMLAAGHTWRYQVAWTVELPPTLFDGRQEWAFTPTDADTVLQLGLFASLPYSIDALRRRGLLRKTIDVE